MVLEVAWGHESTAELLREVNKWSLTDGVEFVIGVRIKHNKDAHWDPYVSLYLLDIADDPRRIVRIEIGCGSSNVPPPEDGTVDAEYLFSKDNDRTVRREPTPPPTFVVETGDSRTLVCPWPHSTATACPRLGRRHDVADATCRSAHLAQRSDARAERQVLETLIHVVTLGHLLVVAM